jgi:hypothetical protein
MAAAPLLKTIVSRDSECMARENIFAIFYFDFMIWYVLIKFLPTDLTIIHISDPGLKMETPPSSSPHEQQ